MGPNGGVSEDDLNELVRGDKGLHPYAARSYSECQEEMRLVWGKKVTHVRSD